MAKGGHARSGPAPDPDALRRDRDGGSWVTLPAEGRQGVVPEWPLSRSTKREREMWELEWRRPQAVMWERNGQELEVALYVRSFIEASERGATTNLRTTVLRQQEALGLSLPGLARNRWRIASDSPAVAEESPRLAARSARERFKVVTGGAA